MSFSSGLSSVLSGNFIRNRRDFQFKRNVDCVLDQVVAPRTILNSKISAPAESLSGPTSFFPRKFALGSEISKDKARGKGIICSATLMDYETLQWVSSIASLVLMFAKGTAIQKSFLAPLITLQAPASIISWFKGEYGIFTAFIGLLVRLFFPFPGELELPFLTALLVIVTPYQAANLRGTQIGTLISLVIAGYLGFQHFSRVGGYQKAIDQGSVIATLAIICIIAVPCLFLF